jgi:hypothetical protein
MAGCGEVSGGGNCCLNRKKPGHYVGLLQHTFQIVLSGSLRPTSKRLSKSGFYACHQCWGHSFRRGTWSSPARRGSRERRRAPSDAPYQQPEYAEEQPDDGPDAHWRRIVQPQDTQQHGKTAGMHGHGGSHQDAHANDYCQHRRQPACYTSESFHQLDVWQLKALVKDRLLRAI